MVGSCAALNCTTSKGAPGISFHRFPHRNPELLTKWVHNMGSVGSEATSDFIQRIDTLFDLLNS